MSRLTTEDPWADLVAEFRSAGLETHRDLTLARYTTYGVGGAARCAVVIPDAEAAEKAATVLSTGRPVPTLVVGKGSNLVVADDGFDGVALLVGTSSGTGGVRVEGEVVIADGGTPMPVLARRSAAVGRGGLEWAVGIPGTVGGAVRMNAGGHGSDMDDAVIDADIVSCVSGRRARVSGKDLGFHFRGSALAPHHLVVRVALRSHEVDPARASEEINAIVAWRREHQPGGRNAGSVFVNPGDGDFAAGALIDACGLRGLRRGGAQVSEKHANFIQADEDTTASDIVELMTVIQDVVADARGVRLRSEVRLVGFDRAVMERFSDPRHESPDHSSRRHQLATLLGETWGTP